MTKLPPDGVKECEMCGATKSVQWRRGPDGELNLCNRCGLRVKRKGKSGFNDESLYDAKHIEKHQYVPVKITRQMKKFLDFYQTVENVSMWVEFLVNVEDNLLK